MTFSFWQVLFLALLGLGVSFGMERFVKPLPNVRRPFAAWCVHTGIYVLVYALLVLILARPYFSLVVTLALVLTLVMINNAKLRNLAESLTAQDYEFIMDIIMYPRLFLPYFGVKKFLQAASGFVLALVGFIYEPVPDHRLALSVQGGAILILLCLAIFCLIYAYGHTPPKASKVLQTRFRPLEDMQNLGLMTTLWVHGFALRQKPNLDSSPFIHLPPQAISPLPHLVAVQSESFFDPRPLYSGIKKDVLASYDALCQESAQCGALHVPSFGGSTVRSEFSFLSGLDQDALGAHRFNPYVVTASGYPIPSLLTFLKKMGYDIICIHPYVRSFYKRDKVFQHWQVDTYLDMSHFPSGHRFGPYMSDISVTKMILQCLEKAQKPTCIFTVTMENHGPLHLEKVREKDIARLYDTPPPPDFEDLTVYLRHLRHADTMIARLRQRLQDCAHPASLCWYGDHVPIMAKVYDAVPPFAANTQYLIWNNKALQDILPRVEKQRSSLASHELSATWLKHALWQKNDS